MCSKLEKYKFRYLPVLLCRQSLQFLQVSLHKYVYDMAFCPTALQRISWFHTSITPASSPPALRNTVPPPWSQFRSLPQSSFPSFIILTVFLFYFECLLLIKHRLLLFNFKIFLHESFSTFPSAIKMSLPSFDCCLASL